MKILLIDSSFTNAKGTNKSSNLSLMLSPSSNATFLVLSHTLGKLSVLSNSSRLFVSVLSKMLSSAPIGVGWHYFNLTGSLLKSKFYSLEAFFSWYNPVIIKK